jgi:hypothetical protein
MVPRFMTLSLFFADVENSVPSGRMYPRRLPPSERRELTERADETDEAVETERSSGGMAPMAKDGVAQGSGEVERAGGELDVSMVVDRGGRCKAVAVVRLLISREIRCFRILGIDGAAAGYQALVVFAEPPGQMCGCCYVRKGGAFD